jgi:hypothetical protein
LVSRFSTSAEIIFFSGFKIDWSGFVVGDGRDAHLDN